MDTTLVTIVRLLNGRSPLQGGRDHVSHRLVRVGLPVPVAVALIYTGGVSVGAVAFVVARVDLTSAWVLASLVGLLLTGFGVLLARVPVYEGSSRTLYTISAEATGDTK
jgi:UDP-GlcNAc:undecaprenyl-phosphate/decaprenyl-phosphate GlcNAc-1-phosphate transferase